MKAGRRSTWIPSLCKCTGNPAAPSGFPRMHTGALEVLDRLASQDLISPVEGAETPVFVLAEHLVERLGRTGQADELAGARAPGLVTDQAGLEPRSLSTVQAGSAPTDLSTVQATRSSGSIVPATTPASRASHFRLCAYDRLNDPCRRSHAYLDRNSLNRVCSTS